MDMLELLAADDPETLTAKVTRFGKGCGACAHTPPEPGLPCHYCEGLNCFPRLSPRKLRLLACGFCRVVAWKRLGATARRAVLDAERYAEGQAVASELTAAYAQTADDLAAASVLRDDAEAARRSVREAMKTLGQHRPLLVPAVEYDRQAAQEKRLLCDVIRDVVGDPTRPVAIDPAWLDANGGQALAIARAIDLDGRFDELPILADALEDGGCTNQTILDHARQQRHYRGCWLLDAVLGKWS